MLTKALHATQLIKRRKSKIMVEEILEEVTNVTVGGVLTIVH